MPRAPAISMTVRLVRGTPPFSARPSVHLPRDTLMKGQPSAAAAASSSLPSPIATKAALPGKRSRSLAKHSSLPCTREDSTSLPAKKRSRRNRASLAKEGSRSEEVTATCRTWGRWSRTPACGGVPSAAPSSTGRWARQAASSPCAAVSQPAASVSVACQSRSELGSAASASRPREYRRCASRYRYAASGGGVQGPGSFDAGAGPSQDWILPTTSPSKS
ncbi:hypothetical protein F751_4098 [Auxenochlorella protothecoides]|uniref:Uncharacterized protein n=1 Tax=Auxenochlorella protothecoides TaxID=3075 RepID=A0A087ST80_AUXPR|nr:hypothetical protein F751_4098 [Auxenochlorella protothecoides]KFM28934.1 hypothetical protein F751_4098 [Auxenochlorella protothecoides]